ELILELRRVEEERPIIRRRTDVFPVVLEELRTIGRFDEARVVGRGRAVDVLVALACLAGGVSAAGCIENVEPELARRLPQLRQFVMRERRALEQEGRDLV